MPKLQNGTYSPYGNAAAGVEMPPRQESHSVAAVAFNPATVSPRLPWTCPLHICPHERIAILSRDTRNPNPVDDVDDNDSGMTHPNTPPMCTRRFYAEVPASPRSFMPV